jgi:alpha-beta hydrolase superfamily lysophospholipase
MPKIISKKIIYKNTFVSFIIFNLIIFTITYALTHFRTPGQLELGFTRPINNKSPSLFGLKYIDRRIWINKKEWLGTWFIPAKNYSSRGTIVLFPGNGDTKGNQLLEPAKIFHTLNYDLLLVDFRGVGDSSGNTRTIGVQEAKDVVFAFNYARKLNPKNPIVLYGVSMGSAAILRAIAQENIQPDAIILELPFARLTSAVKSRLEAFHIPPFPTTELLVFWGGIQHGFNGFLHNPVTYAKAVNCPTLILHGKQDKWTNLTEINELFQNLQGNKKLVIFPTAGHQLLVTVDKQLWYWNVEQFL